MNSIKYITVEQVIFLNKALIERYNKHDMVKIVNQGSLESAVERPRQSVFGEDAYKTIEDKAAALYESLTKNHPFVDGNKRTAFSSMYMFLYLNGYRLRASEEDAIRVTLYIANSKMNFKEISIWIKNNKKS